VAVIQTWKMQAKGLGPAQYRAQQSWNPLREAGADFAIDLHPAEPVKGYAEDAPPLRWHDGSNAAAPGMFDALPVYPLLHAKALADCWNLTGCDLRTVLVVDCRLRSNVYWAPIYEVGEVKRIEGEEQVEEAQKQRAVAGRCPGAGDLKVEDA
jgi:hypothetical protein